MHLPVTPNWPQVQTHSANKEGTDHLSSVISVSQLAWGGVGVGEDILGVQCWG